MRTHLLFLCLLCSTFFLSVARASDKPRPSKAADYSCSYYDASKGKYYCVETTASCGIAHAYVKESGTTATPVLVVLALKSSTGCPIYEGSLVLPTGSTIVINVQTCDCGNNLTTHVFFVGRDV